jgi:5-methyltetrahydropteroyltriglutamate--homocysteine methyltransferase
MTIPTEPIGSIPRPLRLLKAISQPGILRPALESLYEEAVRDTIKQFEATGSPVVTDGEQTKYHNFATYCVEGLPNTAPDGFKLPFAAGHVRRLPRLTGGPFRFLIFGYDLLERALKYAHVPVKQAIISPSALSLMYPAENLPGYSREEFITDLLEEHEKDIRGCLAKGAHKMQIDFTEGRLAVKVDPSGSLLNRLSSTIWRLAASPRWNAVGSEFIPALGRTGIPPTVRRWITPRSCQACSRSGRETSISHWLGNLIAPTC